MKKWNEGEFKTSEELREGFVRTYQPLKDAIKDAVEKLENLQRSYDSVIRAMEEAERN